MNNEGQERNVKVPMQKRKVQLEDGRYLIFYNFNDGSPKGSKAGEKERQPQKLPKQKDLDV